MNTHYTKDDVVKLASSIFVNDLASDTVSQSGAPIKDIAGASFFAAETFFNMAAAYHRGELDTTLDACHNDCTASPEPEECRQGGRRGSAVEKLDAAAAEELAAIERALKEQFLAATLNSIFRNAAKG